MGNADHQQKLRGVARAPIAPAPFEPRTWLGPCRPLPPPNTPMAIDFIIISLPPRFCFAGFFQSRLIFLHLLYSTYCNPPKP